LKTIKYEELVNRLIEYDWKNNIPGTGFFELTPYCNLDCKMCYVHLQDPSVKEKMLSGKQWIALIQEAIEHGMTRACLSGGEAMTHPDFLEIYMFLINSGVAVQVKTNGILLEEQMLEVFKKYPPLMLDVSLYGCDSESYIAVTGVDAYERVVSNIQTVLDNKLNTRIMITPSEYVMPWIEQVMRLADSFGVSVMLTDFLIHPNDNTGRSKEDYDIDDSQFEMIDRLKYEIFNEEDLAKDEYEPDIEMEAAMSTMSSGLRCLGGRGMFTINWDGTMSPCVSFPRDIVVGEPLITGFDASWKKINEAVRNYEIPQNCHTCEIQNKCNYCPVKHSRFSPVSRCDEQVCNYLRNRNNRDTR